MRVIKVGFGPKPVPTVDPFIAEDRDVEAIFLYNTGLEHAKPQSLGTPGRPLTRIRAGDSGRPRHPRPGEWWQQGESYEYKVDKLRLDFLLALPEHLTPAGIRRRVVARRRALVGRAKRSSPHFFVDRFLTVTKLRRKPEPVVSPAKRLVALLEKSGEFEVTDTSNFRTLDGLLKSLNTEKVPEPSADQGERELALPEEYKTYLPKLLVGAGLARTLSHARTLINDGYVTIEGWNSISSRHTFKTGDLRGKTMQVWPRHEPGTEEATKHIVRLV